jgi:hypothetical protein
MRLQHFIVLPLLLAACGMAPTSTGAGSDGPNDIAADAPTASSTSPIGTNLTGIVDWSTEWTFVDAFKASRPWISGTASQWDDSRPLDLDDDGWVRSLLPGQLARTLLLPSGHYPAGRYVVLYDGEGALAYGGGGVVESSTPGRDVVVADGAQPVIMTITATTAGNPLRNIRFLMPGGVCSTDHFRYCDDASPCGDAGTCERFEDVYASQIFHPTFLSRLRGYRTLRFMDWMQTNNSSITTTGPRVSDARWSSKGVPVEILVALANRLGADAWINVPHRATDEYVSQLATTLHEQLDPNHKVYVEYSNEVWNSIFTQGTYAEQQGVALGLATTPFEARLRFQSRRSVEIFKIFETVFPTEDRHRLVRVLAAQAANSWTSTVLLDHADALAHVDALAIAPYFGGYLGSPERAATVRAMTLDDLFTELQTVAVPESLGWVTSQVAEATTRGVPVIAYEAGNHLVGIGGMENDATINALFDAANRDPRMKEVYETYLEGWKANGGQLLVHFVNCSAFDKWGRWGALEYLDEPRSAAPKYDAIFDFIEHHAAWW